MLGAAPISMNAENRFLLTSPGCSLLSGQPSIERAVSDTASKSAPVSSFTSARWPRSTSTAPPRLFVRSAEAVTDCDDASGGRAAPSSVDEQDVARTLAAMALNNSAGTRGFMLRSNQTNWTHCLKRCDRRRQSGPSRRGRHRLSVSTAVLGHLTTAAHVLDTSDGKD